MSRTKTDGDAYGEAQALAREVREDVADQLHDLVIEREAMGSREEVGQRVQHVVRQVRQVSEAQGRQLQAREMGLPIAPALEQELEARDLLRSAVMNLGAACGLYVAAMDFERRRPLTSTNGGGEG